VLASISALLIAANPSFESGKHLFGELEFEAAAQALSLAVEEPGLSTDERREAFDLWAQSLIATGDVPAAERAYARLFKVDPYVPPPRASPKVVDAFRAAKARVFPRPSVSLQGELRADRRVLVRLLDPWALVARVRWFEVSPSAVSARPSPELEERTLTVAPTLEATSVLFDALGKNDALLAHLEVKLGDARWEPAPPRPRWPVVTLLGGAALAVGAAVTFFALGLRSAPELPTALDVNTWNSAVTANLALGWTFTGLAAGLGTAGGIVLAR